VSNIAWAQSTSQHIHVKVQLYSMVQLALARIIACAAVLLLAPRSQSTIYINSSSRHITDSSDTTIGRTRYQLSIRPAPGLFSLRKTARPTHSTYSRPHRSATMPDHRNDIPDNLQGVEVEDEAELLSHVRISPHDYESVISTCRYIIMKDQESGRCPDALAG